MTDLASELRDIERKLFEIPDEKVAQLTLLIERSRAVVLSAAMADAALGTLRPRLVRTRPPRHLTLQRIFCHPFEDLLVIPEDQEKQFGRISRASLAPCWDYVVHSLDAASVKQLEATLRSEAAPSIGAVADPRIPKLGATLWSIAARRLREDISRADSDAAFRADLAEKLGGEAALADLADMTGMLEIAAPLEKLREELSPKPVGKMLDEQVEAVKEAFAAVSASGAGLPGYVIAFTIARMTDGFQLLPVCDGMADAPTGFDGLTPGQYARRMLAGDSKRFFKSLGRVDAAKVPDINVAGMVEDFVRLVGRMEADGMADGPQPEMDVARSRLHEVVKTGMLDSAGDTVLPALQAPDGAVDAKAAKDAAFEAKLQAETRVFAIQKVARVAQGIGADKAVGLTLKTLGQQIEQGGGGLVADIKAGKMNALGKDAVKQQLYGAVRMLELVGGSQAAGKLMKDGLAAIEKMPD
ncbi:hypothetical protein [Ferrovibrio sp.]|uniref:hypothetical protein n=1 Tax=Ferrovibrio sp. TaxID=1917215 RepID=UPI00311D4579